MYIEFSDKSYYVGVTNDAEERVEQHNMGINKKAYTYIRRPVKLVFHQVFNNPLSAISFEKKLKGWSRKKKEALIRGEWERLPELSYSNNRQNYLSLSHVLRQAQEDDTQIEPETG